MNSFKRRSAAVPGARLPAITLLSMAAVRSAIPGWYLNLGGRRKWSDRNLIATPEVKGHLEWATAVGHTVSCGVAGLK